MNEAAILNPLVIAVTSRFALPTMYTKTITRKTLKFCAPEKNLENIGNTT